MSRMYINKSIIMYNKMFVASDQDLLKAGRTLET